MKLIPPLLSLVARATDSELARYVEFLKAENQILLSKLPKRVQVTEAERQRLIQLGLRVGPAIKEPDHHRLAQEIPQMGQTGIWLARRRSVPFSLMSYQRRKSVVSQGVSRISAAELPS